MTSKYAKIHQYASNTRNDRKVDKNGLKQAKNKLPTKLYWLDRVSSAKLTWAGPDRGHRPQTWVEARVRAQHGHGHDAKWTSSARCQKKLMVALRRLPPTAFDIGGRGEVDRSGGQQCPVAGWLENGHEEEEDQLTRKVESLAAITTTVKVGAAFKRTLTRRRCHGGRPRWWPKRARKGAAPIESYEQKTAADGDCGGANVGDGHGLIARSEGDMFMPVQWLEVGRILTNGSPKWQQC